MIDLQEPLQLALRLAKQCGEHISEGLANSVEFTTKSDDADRLTKTDIECERIITSAIHDAYPDHDILGEEGEGDQELTSEYRWVIDPIDGTSNFTHRLPFCGTSIALEHKGKSILGVLHFPALHETYFATLGNGAFCNEQQIHVEDVPTLRDAVVAEIFSDRIHRGKEIMFPPSLTYRKFGSAITSQAYIAKGSIHATSLVCYRWDIAAAEIIISEAGGMMTYAYKDPQNPRSSLHAIVSSPSIHEEFTKFIQEEIQL